MALVVGVRPTQAVGRGGKGAGFRRGGGILGRAGGCVFASGEAVFGAR